MDIFVWHIHPLTKQLHASFHWNTKVKLFKEERCYSAYGKITFLVVTQNCVHILCVYSSFFDLFHYHHKKLLFSYKINWIVDIEEKWKTFSFLRLLSILQNVTDVSNAQTSFWINKWGDTLIHICLEKNLLFNSLLSFSKSLPRLNTKQRSSYSGKIKQRGI